ncbi:MAG TPA: PQQ-dependent sugar dehydrogenase, partial [Steroidobacteraceae bacterium]|nr:PQQ-dependent sugar dehydrogenase [Steroidobacteraceae bacterium]
MVLIAGCHSGEEITQTPEPPPPPPPPPAPTSGLDARPSNTTCIAPERATGSVTIGTERVFPNLSFREPGTFESRNPLWMGQAPGDSSRWFVVERFGTVRVFDNNPGVSATSVVIDLRSRVDSSCQECGLLGMAFHPDFPATPRVYLSYTSLERPLGGPDSRLSEFTSPDGGRTLDPNSERIILTISKRTVHHHGGGVGFGPDGFLYLSMGD